MQLRLQRRRALIAGLVLSICALPAWADPAQSGSEVPSWRQRLADMLDFEPAGQSAGASYYTPTQAHRDIDVMAINLSRGWKFWGSFELQSQFSVFHAHGSRTDAPFGVDPDSAATGVAVGPGLRLYILDFAGAARVRPFLEGSAQFLVTPGTADGFPSGGSGVNGFERAGAGIRIRLRAHLAIEATYQWYSHVSNAAGVSPQNPMWNGHGGSLALHREF